MDRLAQRLRDAETRIDRQEEFFAAAGRELSNALGPVLLGIERMRPLLAARDLDRAGQALDMLERACSGLARRARVAQQLMDLGSGTNTLALADTELRPALEEAAARHGQAARHAGCALVVDAPDRLAAWAAPDALALVLDEMLVNAFRHAPGRPVRLEARPDGAHAVTLAVADEGPGIDPGMLAAVFAPRRHDTEKGVPGLGVALFVASQLVTAMGGSIAAENRAGAGAQFCVTLRAAPMPG